MNMGLQLLRVFLGGGRRRICETVLLRSGLLTASCSRAIQHGGPKEESTEFDGTTDSPSSKHEYCYTV